MSSDPGASVMLQVVRRGHACGEAGARVCCSSFSVCFFLFKHLEVLHKCWGKIKRFLQAGESNVTF